MPVKPNVTMIWRILRWSLRSPPPSAYTVYCPLGLNMMTFAPIIRLSQGKRNFVYVMSQISDLKIGQLSMFAWSNHGILLGPGVEVRERWIQRFQTWRFCWHEEEGPHGREWGLPLVADFWLRHSKEIRTSITLPSRNLTLMRLRTLGSGFFPRNSRWEPM